MVFWQLNIWAEDVEGNRLAQLEGSCSLAEFVIPAEIPSAGVSSRNGTVVGIFCNTSHCDRVSLAVSCKNFVPTCSAGIPMGLWNGASAGWPSGTCYQCSAQTIVGIMLVELRTK